MTASRACRWIAVHTRRNSSNSQGHRQSTSKRNLARCGSLLRQHSHRSGDRLIQALAAQTSTRWPPRPAGWPSKREGLCTWRRACFMTTSPLRRPACDCLDQLRHRRPGWDATPAPPADVARTGSCRPWRPSPTRSQRNWIGLTDPRPTPPASSSHDLMRAGPLPCSARWRDAPGESTNSGKEARQCLFTSESTCTASVWGVKSRPVAVTCASGSDLALGHDDQQYRFACCI